VFFFLALVNNTAMTEGVQISSKDYVFNSFEYTCKSGIAGSCCCLILNALRPLHSVSYIV
jgi:hypothetical protein